MIFEYTLDQVIRGEKTQTRRMIGVDQHLIDEGATPHIETVGKRVLYAVGKSYAVQPGRGKKSVARIELTGIRREAVDAISQADAHAEGCASAEAFIAQWRSIHGAKTSIKNDVWVLTFKLIRIDTDAFTSVTI